MPLSSDATLLGLLRATHAATVRAVLQSDGQEYTLPVVGGSVSIDARRGVRRSLSLEVVDIDGTLTGSGHQSPLAPYGARIAVYRGVLDPLTQTTPSNLEVQVGLFAVTSVSMQAGEDGAIMVQVSGEDLAYTISRTRYRTGIEVVGDTRYSDPNTAAPGAMQQILNALDNLPSFAVDLPLITNTINFKWFGSDPGEDPWVPLTLLGQALGFEVYFTNTGTLTATVVPTLTGDPDWTYLQDESNVILSVSRTLDSEEVLNGVQMTSLDSKAGEVSAESYNESLQSPTRANGPLGRRPIKIDNPYVRTSGQAQVGVDRLINAYIGQPVEWVMIPNPAMDVRDRVRVVDARLNMDVTVLVDSISLPLDPTGTMTVRGRTL